MFITTLQSVYEHYSLLNTFKNHFNQLYIEIFNYPQAYTSQYDVVIFLQIRIFIYFTFI